ESRDRADVVGDGERVEIAQVLRLHELLRLLGDPFLLRPGLAARRRQPSRRVRRLFLARGFLALLDVELVLDLAHGLVQERAGSVHDPDRARVHPRELPAWAVGASDRLIAGGHVAGDATLETEESLEVGCQHQVWKRLPDQNQDRLLAEAP